MRVSALPSWAAQQCPVAAADKPHAVASEADGDFANRVADPASGFNFVPREKMLSDDTVNGAGMSRVHDAEHLARTLLPL